MDFLSSIFHKPNDPFKSVINLRAKEKNNHFGSVQVPCDGMDTFDECISMHFDNADPNGLRQNNQNRTKHDAFSQHALCFVPDSPIPVLSQGGYKKEREPQL